MPAEVMEPKLTCLSHCCCIQSTVDMDATQLHTLRMGVACLCRLSRNILAHDTPLPEALLPDPITLQLPSFRASDIDVCRMLPDLLSWSEVDFIAKTVDMLTKLKPGISVPPSGSSGAAAAPGPSSSTAIADKSKSRGLAPAAVSSRLLLGPPPPMLPRQPRRSLVCLRQAKRVANGCLLAKTRPAQTVSFRLRQPCLLIAVHTLRKQLFETRLAGLCCTQA